MPASSGKKPARGRAGGVSQAARADRHRLYERAVQCPEAELDLMERVFQDVRRRRPRSIREDFCGTALVCAHWVRRRRSHRATGVDRDPEVLAYAARHHLRGLTPGARARVSLLHADVMEVRTAPVDVVLATNFSYWVFDRRATLRAYFRRAREALVPDGVLMLDAFGGYDTYRVLRERTEHPDFTYVWHQADYDPLSGRGLCHIHFQFPDGSRLERAFSYAWRLWTLPEIREVLGEAGFSRVEVLLEGIDAETGRGSGEFTPAGRGQPDAGWIAYLAAAR